jgi:hypothetical protein
LPSPPCLLSGCTRKLSTNRAFDGRLTTAWGAA